MEEKLEKIAERFQEIERLLSDPAVYGDREQTAKLSREQKELAPLMDVWASYCRASKDEADAREMLGDPIIMIFGMSI